MADENDSLLYVQPHWLLDRLPATAIATANVSYRPNSAVRRLVGAVVLADGGQASLVS